MNNFIYENRTKVYFGRGCMAEFLGRGRTGRWGAEEILRECF